MLLGIILAVIGAVLFLAAWVEFGQCIKRKRYSEAILTLIFGMIPAIVTFLEGIELMS